jgi:hypothetical protein
MSERLVHTMVALAFVSALTVLALATVPVNSAADAPNPITVRGTIYDNAGNEIPDIPVTVNMKDGATVVTTKLDTSSSLGVYSVLFGVTEWEVGYTIEVTATGPSGQENETAIAPDDFQITIDVQFAYEIPEFGFDAGVLVAGGAVGFIAVAVLVWKRK